MAIADDSRVEMWKEVLGLCAVKAGESVVVLTSESSHPLNIDAAMRSSLALGATTLMATLPPLVIRKPVAGDRTTYLGVTPLSGHRMGVELLKSADVVIDLMGLLHSPEQREILDSGTRILMVVEPPEVLAQMMPEANDKRRVMAADNRLRRAREMRVTSDAGTDLTLALGQFEPLPEYGFTDEPGHWDHWPSGFISTWPNEGSANGRVVIDVGDMMFPFKMYVSSPITLEIEGGCIRSIEGGFEATYLRRHIESYDDPGAFAVSHVGWGLQPKAKWTALGMRDKAQSLGMDARAYYGNFLFSTGPNAEAGGANNSRCHVDIPMAGCSVSLDSEPMTAAGDVVAVDQRVA
ncbi:MAG TPA: 2,5-dihydroxypyridine 5,6-dioxygenase [Hyphomicrobiales bacterium]|nr:2,5-dihydroxypyridine 5,6-dioxygenase [Hyphomicrobiales bacterium]